MGDLWTIDDMAAAMAAGRAGVLPEAVTGISIDSRTIKPGEAFFAIKGDAHDGHDFVASAVRAKAGVAVVPSRKRAGVGEDAPLLVVRDVLDGLAQASGRCTGALRRADHCGDRFGRQDLDQGSPRTSRCPVTARPMRLLPRSTIIGASRSRSRACRRARVTPCSRSA